MHQERAPEELRSEIASVHGSAVAWLIGGTPTPAMTRPGEARVSKARARRTRSARKEGGRGSGARLPVQSQALASIHARPLPSPR
jgi:hypothetical protein